jgi:hypothetical protein
MNDEKFNSYFTDSFAVVQSFVGASPKRSTLHVYSIQEWKTFIGVLGLEPSTAGVYFAKSLSAHTLKPSEFFLLNMFHEFFGHGTYFEKSTNGTNIVRLEQQLAAIPQDTDDHQYLATEIKRLCSLAEAENEGFAVSVEKMLADHYGFGNLFSLKAKHACYDVSNVGKQLQLT